MSMLISRSVGRKVVATATAATAFVLLYEVTVMDSRFALRQATEREDTAPPSTGATSPNEATWAESARNRSSPMRWARAAPGTSVSAAPASTVPTRCSTKGSSSETGPATSRTVSPKRPTRPSPGCTAMCALDASTVALLLRPGPGARTRIAETGGERTPTGEIRGAARSWDGRGGTPSPGPRAARG